MGAQWEPNEMAQSVPPGIALPLSCASEQPDVTEPFKPLLLVGIVTPILSVSTNLAARTEPVQSRAHHSAVVNTGAHQAREYDKERASD